MNGARASIGSARAPWRVWPLLFALTGTACSWLVNPEHDAPRCAMDGGPNLCGEGSVCIAGRCRAVECSETDICGDHIDNDCDDQTDEDPITKEDICNYQDDDCDGQTDEDADPDKDTFTWCGKPQDKNSKDCDELNPHVHPEAEEICDGIDNDCNQKIDEVSAGESLCQGDKEECIRGRCVVPTCAVEGSRVTCDSDENCVNGECVSAICNAMMCAPGTYCDMATGTCTTPPPKAKNGADCTTNSDCLSELCIDAAALRMPGRTGRVCGEACCANKDCDADEVCFASGTGARSCLPRTEVSATKQCSNDDGCTTPERCIISRVMETGNEARAAFNAGVCSVPTRTQDLGEACFGYTSCVSSLCVPDPLSILGACSVPCQVSSDCAGLYLTRPGLTLIPASGPPHEYCRYIDLAQMMGNTPDTGDYAAGCVMGYETGDKKFGEKCSANNECADGVCIMGGANGGYCAPTCCHDDQCRGMAPGRDNPRCVPMARGKHYEMRCSL
jgi:hypothetical protein